MGKLARRRPGSVSVKELVEQAKSAKDAGNNESALEKLLQAAKRKVASPQVQIAIYELALLYAQLGRHEDSDQWLQQLGFAWKLNPVVLDSSCLLGNRSQGESNLVVAFDNALPLQLLAALQEAFKPDAAFWTEHGYPTPSFFSYNQPIEQDSNLITSAARCLERFAAESFGKILANDRVVSVEWWAHSRPSGSGSGHQLHFDLDEVDLKTLEETAIPKHPLVSCVLYLSCGSSCSTTMVTDQNLEPQSRAKRAWLCEPKVNRALLFNGSLLHGVIPNLASASESQEPRTTLMLGLWGRQPSCSPPPEAPGGGLGPNMRLPEKGFDWPSSLQAAESLTKCPRLEVSPVNLAGPVSPVWCSVPQPSEPSSCSVDFIGKWFLREAPEELQRMAPTLEALEVEEVSMEELQRLRETQLERENAEK